MCNMRKNVLIIFALIMLTACRGRHLAGWQHHSGWGKPSRLAYWIWIDCHRQCRSRCRDIVCRRRSRKAKRHHGDRTQPTLRTILNDTPPHPCVVKMTEWNNRGRRAGFTLIESDRSVIRLVSLCSGSPGRSHCILVTAPARRWWAFPPQIPFHHSNLLESPGSTCRILSRKYNYATLRDNPFVSRIPAHCRL